LVQSSSLIKSGGPVDFCSIKKSTKEAFIKSVSSDHFVVSFSRPAKRLHLGELNFEVHASGIGKSIAQKKPPTFAGGLCSP
jgi:hypothetical protein